MQATHPRLTLGVEIERSHESVLVHNSRTAKVHVLNDSAGFILERCDGKRSIDQIASELAKSVAVSDDLRGDVTAIVDEFAKLGLIEIEGHAS